MSPSDNGPWALQRLFHLGDHVFDRQSYDAGDDVLTVWKSFGVEGGGPEETYDSPEGHSALYDRRGRLVSVSLTAVAARLATDGAVAITLRGEAAATAADAAEALTASPGAEEEDEEDEEERYPRAERPPLL